LGNLTDADQTGIFAQGDITAPMATIFNVPMVTHQGQELRWGSLLSGERGQAISALVCRFALARNRPFDLKDLRHLWPAWREITTQLTTHMQLANFDPSMRFVDRASLAFGKEKGSRRLTEEPSNCFLEYLLIAKGNQ
jgi:hypothetical protein